LFGKVVNGKIILNKFGKVAENEWLRTSTIRDEIDLDDYIIMPNHIHGIVNIRCVNNIPLRFPYNRDFLLKPKSLGSFIAGY
jgi:putative transposase